MKLHRRELFQRTALGGVVAGVLTRRSPRPQTSDLRTVREHQPSAVGRQGGPPNAQTVFVDARKGRDQGTGTVTDPIGSLQGAIALASRFTGDQPITITVAPGLYVLPHLAEIRTGKSLEVSSEYSIEAAVMPDDPDWQPEKMPVIQSISPDNSVTQFTHCTGCLVSRPNVSFKGLKFVGNVNPDVRYYYPIGRENENYRNLRISQCYFIGERNSSPVQGAIWAHGAGIDIAHCIFYGCRNALIALRSIADFSLRNSIIVGAYEAAVWFGPLKGSFVFRDNIVTGCNFFWVRPENTFPEYTFSRSLITDNGNYMGFFTPKGLVAATKNSHEEIDIRKTGKVILSEVKTSGLPKDYLNQLPASDGNDIPAGIFGASK